MYKEFMTDILVPPLKEESVSVNTEKSEIKKLIKSYNMRKKYNNIKIVMKQKKHIFEINIKLIFLLFYECALKMGLEI